MKAPLLLSMCLMSSIGFVGAMDFKKAKYLKFRLDNNLRILNHEAKNMETFSTPEKFLGEVITETIPLEAQDLNALNNGFQKAMADKKKQKVKYTLKDKQYVAAIKHKSKKNGYSVKVKEIRS
jgi:hypothetical protein